MKSSSVMPWHSSRSFRKGGSAPFVPGARPTRMLTFALEGVGHLLIHLSARARWGKRSRTVNRVGRIFADLELTVAPSTRTPVKGGAGSPVFLDAP
jgi:hypothetical protein